MKQKVYPGLNRQFVWRGYARSERNIITQMSKEWYVTNGGEELRLGPTSTYRYFLVKPTDQYREMFNLEREVLVVFSPYETFESRTLDAIDAAAKRFQPLRLERVCSIVISQDPNVENKLVNILKNDQESQIVIPFTYDELTNIHDPYFMRNRLKSHFYTRDLFKFEAPLKRDLYFFGMSDLVHTITNRHASNENSALFGLRKTGKTSVIFGLERTLNRSGGKSVFIDCQSPAFHRRRWNKVLHYVLSETVRQHDLSTVLSQEETFTEEDAAILFETDLLKLHEELDGKNLLMIFDEVENITFRISPSEHWAEGPDFIYFWQTLRSIFQKLNRVFSYLIVGTNPMCIESPTINGKDNPIFNQVPFQYIPRFDVPQTREMVHTIGSIMGLQFDEILFGRLTEDFGGHPFLIRHVCSVINDIIPPERPMRIHKGIYESAKEIFNREHSNYIDMILSVLQQFYNDEYAMMEYLADGDVETFTKFAQSSPSYTNHLLGYGIIEQHGDGYTFRIESVREYLKNKRKYRRINLTPQDMLQEISERRNALEPRIRSIVRTQLQASLGKPDAKIAVLAILGDPRKTTSGVCAYEELFDPNVSLIFFEDIRKIIVKHWDVFKNIFMKDKEEFDAKMKSVNKYRIDAHAKTLTEDEMNYFRVCIASIEKQVNEFLD